MHPTDVPTMPASHILRPSSLLPGLWIAAALAVLAPLSLVGQSIDDLDIGVLQAAEPGVAGEQSATPPGGPGGSGQAFTRTLKAQIEGFLDRSSYAPGETARVLARVLVDDGWHIQAHVPTYDYLIPTELALTSSTPGVALVAHGEAETVDPPRLVVVAPTYPAPIQWSAPFAGDEILDVYEGETFISTAIQIPPDTEPQTVELVLTLSYQACDDRVCLQPSTATTSVLLEVGAAGEPTNGDLFDDAATTVAARGGDPELGGIGPGLGWMVLFGLLGGLLLNLMPCVLPVLSIKVFGLLRSAEEGHGSVRRGALAFSAGIITSFWLLAAGAILLRAAGEAIGWGIQFQNPVFVAFLTLVMVFFSLNLWGLFEVPLPGFLGGGAGSGNGLAGHFGAGFLATLMATPCSAPFLGTAIGFALARPPAAILIIFTAVGVGLALPNLLLAVSPRAARLLPRPGAWMETLKGVFGFLLAGTAVWLLYVLSGQIASEGVAFLQGALLLVGLATYLHRRWRTREPLRRLAAVGMTLAAALTLWIAGTAPAAVAGAPVETDYAWQVFDEERALSLAAAGDLVFVDVTADWCATCKVNERVVLANDEVREAFLSREVVMMKADWTNRDEDIARYLARFGRYAIPFYVLYRPGGEPHVFGELLTRRGVIQALDESRKVASRPGDRSPAPLPIPSN